MQKFLILFVLAAMQVGCMNATMKKQLAAHQLELSKAATQVIDPSEKMDILMGSFVRMAGETLRPISPKKGIRYVKAYQSQNAVAISSILGDINNWQKNMNTIQLLGAGAKILGKPYAKDFIRLAPKFEKKYRQYKIATDLLGGVSGTVKGFGKNIF